MVKYEGYLQRQQLEIQKFNRYENLVIPDSFNYSNISGLSNEVLEKFIKVRPVTLGQASRIPGVTPAAISILLVYLKK